MSKKCGRNKLIHATSTYGPNRVHEFKEGALGSIYMLPYSAAEVILLAISLDFSVCKISIIFFLSLS